jgi:hypothetical protein
VSWILFDDLAAERVTMVDIEQALKEESPYLLFYQIVPINEEADEDMNDTTGASPPSVVSVETEGIVDTSTMSARTSSEIPKLIGEECYEAGDKGPSVVLLGSPSEYSERPEASERSESPKLVAENLTQAQTKIDERQSSIRTAYRSSKSATSRSRSRGDDQSPEKRLNAAFSRIITGGRLNRDKLGLNSNSGPEGLEAISKDDPAQGNGQPSANPDLKLKPTKHHPEERDSAKFKKPARGDRKGKVPDRECLVM